MSTRRLAVRAGLLALLLPLSMAAMCVETPDVNAPNVPPVARLLWPQRWLVSTPAPFDATHSSDTDGELVRQTMVFGDGTIAQESPEGTFEHLFTAAGAFEVRLEVEDNAGATSEVLGTLVIVDRIDDPACACETPCLDDGMCTARGCFISAVADNAPLDAEGAPSPDDLVSCR